MATELNKSYGELIQTLKKEISNARIRAHLAVNQEMISLCWRIGKQILDQQQQEGWGAKVIENISNDLRKEFPEMKGLSVQNLKYMRKFAEDYSFTEISQQLVDQIPWGHNIKVLYDIKSKKERFWYIQKTIEHGWSRNILSHQIELGLYGREGKSISNFDNVLPAPQSDLASQIMKDPYKFDFLSIGKDAHEREIKKELIKHIEKFLLELGAGFAFVGKQYKLSVANEDYFIDLLF